MFAEDLDIFLQDFGVSIKAGAISGMGILDINADVVLGGQVVNFDYALTCRADLFGQLSYLSNISVNGVYYEVKNEPISIDDGSFVIIPLQRKHVLPAVQATTIDYDGGNASSAATETNVPQLAADIDGGRAATVFLDGNEINGGQA